MFVDGFYEENMHIKMCVCVVDIYLLLGTLVDRGDHWAVR